MSTIQTSKLSPKERLERRRKSMDTTNIIETIIVAPVADSNVNNNEIAVELVESKTDEVSVAKVELSPEEQLKKLLTQNEIDSVVNVVKSVLSGSPVPLLKVNVLTAITSAMSKVETLKSMNKQGTLKKSLVLLAVNTVIDNFLGDLPEPEKALLKEFIQTSFDSLVEWFVPKLEKVKTWCCSTC